MCLILSKSLQKEAIKSVFDGTSFGSIFHLIVFLKNIFSLKNVFKEKSTMTKFIKHF